jgi:diguanylate cyclase (GGDEF)-like protein
MKRVNDEHGHAAGDRLLRELSQCLSARLRAVDGVYRIGGDEFALLVRDASDGIERRVAERVAATVVDVRRAGFAHVDASVGVARFAVVAHDAAAAVALADARMYEAKRARGARPSRVA